MMKSIEDRLKAMIPVLVRETFSTISGTAPTLDQNRNVSNQGSHNNQVPSMANRLIAPPSQQAGQPNVSYHNHTRGDRMGQTWLNPPITFQNSQPETYSGLPPHTTRNTNPSCIPQYGSQQPSIRNNSQNPQWNPIYHPSSYQNHPFERSRGIEKWGLEFDGTTKTPSVEDFVFRIETLQAYFRVSWTDVLRNMHHFLKKSAQDWLWDFRRMNPNLYDWVIFKKALVSYFHRYETDFDIQRKILDRRQQHNESFDEFCSAILHLRNQQTNPIKEQDLVEIMKGNLKQSMVQLLFAVRPLGLDHFRAEARRAENLINNQKVFQSRYASRNVSELSFGTDTGIEEVNAIEKEKKLICWNCKQDGHMFMDCPSEKRRLFCYRCGYEDTVTPRCPTCQGNRKPNGVRVGSDPRSEKTTTRN